MTPKEAEEYVRSCWPERRLHIYFPSGGFPLLYDFPEIYSGKVDDFPQNIDDIWLAAAEFTRQREKEIQQKREEIIKVQRQVDDHHFFCQRNLYGAERDGAIWERILAVLEAQLAALLVGWKEMP